MLWYNELSILGCINESLAGFGLSSDVAKTVVKNLTDVPLIFLVLGPTISLDLLSTSSMCLGLERVVRMPWLNLDKKAIAVIIEDV